MNKQELRHTEPATRRAPRRVLRFGRRDRTRGQAMVEFALVLPIFVLLLCGMLDFGFALFNRMTVINAAREGARAVVTVDTTSDAALADVPNAAAGAVASAAGSLAVTTSVSCVAIETSGACRFVPSDRSRRARPPGWQNRTTYESSPWRPMRRAPSCRR